MFIIMLIGVQCGHVETMQDFCLEKKTKSALVKT